MAEQQQNLEYARIGQRILAYFLDMILLSAVLIAIGVVATFLVGQSRTLVLLVQFSVPVLLLGYFIYFEGKNGQTLGKRVIGIRVAKENGEPMTYGASVVRNFLRIVDGLFVYIIGVVVIALSSDNQRVGDILANTVVVQE